MSLDAIDRIAGSAGTDSAGNTTYRNAALVSGIGTTISSVGSGIGAIKTDQARARAANYNGNMDLQNAALVAKQNAVNETNLRASEGQQLAEQGASLSQSGFAGGGSQTDVMQQSSINANLQALQERFQGNIARTSLLNAASQQFYDAKVAKSNTSAATMNLVGNGLSGLMATGGRYLNSKTPGTTPGVPANAFTGVTPQNAALLNANKTNSGPWINSMVAKQKGYNW